MMSQFGDVLRRKSYTSNWPPKNIPFSALCSCGADLQEQRRLAFTTGGADELE
jgi:hypothetical protein